MSALLSVSDAHIAYGKVEAVRSVSLEVGDNEIVTIIGANGAGKTTLLNAVMGIMPLKGRVAFAGQDLARIEIEHGLGVGLVAGAGIVAAQRQQIVHAGGGGAEQIALQGDAVAVAAGELQHRLDAGLDQHRRRRQRAQMRPRAGAVGDVDRVGQTFQRQRLGEKLLARGGHRRRDFRGDHKALGRKLFLQGHCHTPTSQNPVDLASGRMRQ